MQIIITISEYFKMDILITRISICIFIIMSIIGIIGGYKLRKEDNLVKKLNGKFLYKYITLFMLVCAMISTIATGVMQFLNKNILGYFVFITILFIIVSLEWMYVHDRINLLIYYPSDKNIDMFFEYFADQKCSHVKYTEIITWLSRWVHYYFRLKTNDIKQSELILKLELLLRPDEDGLCLAAHHQNDFTELCKKMCEHKEENIRLKNITEAYSIMLSNKQEKHKLLESVFLDKNILWYFAIMIMHAVGCILVSADSKLFLGNLLLYLPGDALLLLVYNGIIKQQKIKE